MGVDLDRLALLKGWGVRSVQLTYNLRNLSGGGALEPGNAGLSRHLADGLSKAGWTAGPVEKALGGNLMRVYGESFGRISRASLVVTR